jgi:hypothetical protein
MERWYTRLLAMAHPSLTTKHMKGKWKIIPGMGKN